MNKVEVTWIDAEDHDSTWVGEDEARQFGEDETTATSVGYLISKGHKYLTIGSDYDTKNKNFGTVRKIPVSVIVKIEDLETRKGAT